jgi:hypothetical protein
VVCKLLKNGAPRQIRTADLLVRSQTLYPAELWAHNDQKYSKGYPQNCLHPVGPVGWSD